MIRFSGNNIGFLTAVLLVSLLFAPVSCKTIQNRKTDAPALFEHSLYGYFKAVQDKKWRKASLYWHPDSVQTFWDRVHSLPADVIFVGLTLDDLIKHKDKTGKLSRIEVFVKVERYTENSIKLITEKWHQTWELHKQGKEARWFITKETTI